MDISLIFKITSIGIIISILNTILSKAGKDEYTMITTITGITIVLLTVIDEIKTLFSSLESLFNI